MCVFMREKQREFDIERGEAAEDEAEIRGCGHKPRTLWIPQELDGPGILPEASRESMALSTLGLQNSGRISLCCLSQSGVLCHSRWRRPRLRLRRELSCEPDEGRQAGAEPSRERNAERSSLP